MSDEARRIRELEIALAAMRSDLAGHVALCDGRMRVIWKLATLLSGAIALAVSLGVSMWIGGTP